jgi:hypothetical protein
MSFIRHIGKIGDRKVAVLFREVPGESHMALVTYTETLNQHIHDPMMTCIEGDVGQNSENLADALNRTYTKDGKIMLHVLHSQGLIKKVQTEQVIMTPNSSTRIKLSELNKILDEMKQGEEAVKRLAEIDQSRGLQDPADVARRMRGEPPKVQQAPQGILGDSQLANNLRSQAERMSREAQGLLAESQRLMKEAAEMEGVPFAPQETVMQTTTAPVAKKRGRPAKAKVLA